MNAPAPLPQRRPSRAQRVLETTCQYYGLDARVLCAPTRIPGLCGCPRRCCRCGQSPRSRAYVEMRMILCYVLSTDLVMGHKRIGLLLRRDHSTVVHNVQRAHALLAGRADVRWHLEQLRAILRAQGLVPKGAP